LNKENCKWEDRTAQARNNRHTRLTMAKERRIREFWWAGLKSSNLAELFGVGEGTIKNVLNYKTWREDDRI